MRNYQTSGIVIGRTNFGEADRIVRFITPDRGKVSAVAKGIRRIKSRSGGHLELFGEVSLMMASGKNLDLITSARLVWYPHELTGDYDRVSLAYVMATAIDRVVVPDHPQPEIYELFKEALHAINSGASGALPELWFKLRLLHLTGYHPELSGCLVCGDHDSKTEYFFSPDRGGITCQNDSGPGDRPIDNAAIKLWRLLSDHHYSVVTQIAGAARLADNTLVSCDEFYKYHLGTSFRHGE